MKKVTRLGNLLILLTVVLFLLGCSIIPKSLEKLKEINPFSEPSLTPTLTPLPTSTATLAPTATQKAIPTKKATATFAPLVELTPEPTITPTKKPVSTSAPAKPTATQAQNLVYDMTLKVENKCPEQHIVIFSGPTRLKYTVGAGQTVEYQAPQGTYTWIIDNIYNGGPQDLNINVWTLTLCY